MKRRKTVSVTPAMGARTVAGEIVTVPMMRNEGTAVNSPVNVPTLFGPAELSQNFLTNVLYLPLKMNLAAKNQLGCEMGCVFDYLCRHFGTSAGTRRA